MVKDDDGEVVGCHETEQSAQDQLTALNIAEADDRATLTDLTERQHALAEKYGKVTEHFGRFEKLTGPDSCEYVAAEDNDKAEDGKKCGHCVAFRGGGGCHWVAGEIEVGGLCRYWVIAADKLDPQAQIEPEQDEGDDVAAPDTTEEVAPVPDSRVTERAAPLARVEWRMSGVPENKTIRGYAAMFNSMSYDLGGFREVIAPGAFSNVLATDPDVRLLYNHDDAAVMARTKSRTLELVEDEAGLRIWARVDMADPDVQRVIPKMMRSDVDQMSFAFTVEEDDWDESAGYPLRTIRSIGELFEVSIVPFPAYEATKAEVYERARSTGRVLVARATPTVAEDSPGGSESQVVDLGMGRSRSDEGRIRAAKYRARLSHHKLNIKR